ncbi:unnamed protein product [Adineta steineri]|uniref:Uncharacterized protein n=1 Tax=Adineta steineri TaxID=433720 RepID=A0A813XQF3_9BILA|nr:unnamed protein product [Adineta steineri]CAF4193582.1 unnamed protein product [Adineta steineri]
MFSKHLITASHTYLHLKNHLGHWHNHDHHPAIDDYHGDRHRAMIDLQEHLGQPGTTTKEIEHLMGTPTRILEQPDEILLSELKRNNEVYEYPHDAKIWIYEWRNNHDYVYFILSKDKIVIQSAWYYSYE